MPGAATLSLAESGTLALHREPTDLGVLAGETAAAFRPQAEAAGVTLSLNISDDLPLLAVDPVRLSEVLGEGDLHIPEPVAPRTG